MYAFAYEYVLCLMDWAVFKHMGLLTAWISDNLIWKLPFNAIFPQIFWITFIVFLFSNIHDNVVGDRVLGFLSSCLLCKAGLCKNGLLGQGKRKKFGIIIWEANWREQEQAIGFRI